jgi:NadR type nicotinamide-nucleotide adenylyltransferase
MEKAGSGLVLGKFLPPHAGHQYLVRFAENFCEQLTILVCTLESDPIPGALRYAWVREMFPGSRVVHITEHLPQEPSEHPQFWEIWRRVALEAAGEPLDYIFASEPYGLRLAQEVGGKFIPVDPTRQAVPISGRAIRSDPVGNWKFLPECVRPYFVRRISLFGPESTGKSTLAAELARHFQTVPVMEFARQLLNPQQGVCREADISLIARGQAAAEETLARHANKLLFCDTDPLLTCVWSEFLFGKCPSDLREAARTRHYDLTLLLDIDLPWVDDQQRFLAHRRVEFLARCRQMLEEAGRRYVTIRGNGTARLEACESAVGDLGVKLI